MSRNDHSARGAASAISPAKADLRKQVLARRDAMSAAERACASARIMSRLLAHDAYRNAGCVMAYAGFGSEIDTSRLVDTTLSLGKTLVLPRVERGSRALALFAVEDPASQLEAGVWGIRQPRPDQCARVPASKIDFVLVPGVAFTRSCDRLGYGGGFYDRFIGSLVARRPTLVAAAFSLQVVAELPVADTDQKVDLVMTEGAGYCASHSAK